MIGPIGWRLRRILNGQFEILGQHLKLALKFDARLERYVWRQKGLGRFVDREQDRLPEGIDVLIPEILKIPISAAKRPEAGLKFLNAEACAAWIY